MTIFSDFEFGPANPVPPALIGLQTIATGAGTAEAVFTVPIGAVDGDTVVIVLRNENNVNLPTGYLLEEQYTYFLANTIKVITGVYNLARDGPAGTILHIGYIGGTSLTRMTMWWMRNVGSNPLNFGSNTQNGTNYATTPSRVVSHSAALLFFWGFNIGGGSDGVTNAQGYTTDFFGSSMLAMSKTVSGAATYPGPSVTTIGNFSHVGFYLQV